NRTTCEPTFPVGVVTTMLIGSPSCLCRFPARYEAMRPDPGRVDAELGEPRERPRRSSLPRAVLATVRWEGGFRRPSRMAGPRSALWGRRRCRACTRLREGGFAQDSRTRCGRGFVGQGRRVFAGQVAGDRPERSRTTTELRSVW